MERSFNNSNDTEYVLVPHGNAILSVWGQDFFVFSLFMSQVVCNWKVWMRALCCPKISLKLSMLTTLWQFGFLKRGPKIRKSVKNRQKNGPPILVLSFRSPPLEESPIRSILLWSSQAGGHFEKSQYESDRDKIVNKMPPFWHSPFPSQIWLGALWVTKSIVFWGLRD